MPKADAMTFRPHDVTRNQLAELQEHFELPSRSATIKAAVDHLHSRMNTANGWKHFVNVLKKERQDAES